MSSSVARGVTESHGKSFALSCLNAEIDGYSARMPRKALADECDKSEQTFSKMTGGTQAFGLDDFERLPRDLQVKWMQRYGREVLGVSVRELDPSELTEEFHELVDRLHAVAKLSRVVTRTQLKAGLHTAEERKAG